jgi:tetratricopeptide (TPR) repeat protein
MSDSGISAEQAKSNMSACAGYIVERITNSDAKTEASGKLVDYYLSIDDVDNAAECADSLSDPFARDTFLIGVIAKCVDLKDDEYATQLVDAVEDPGLKSRAKAAMALRLGARGDYTRALEVADSIVDSSDTLAGIAYEMAVAGNNDLAKETVSKIDFLSPRVDVESQIAGLLLKNDQKPASIEWLELAELESGEIDFVEERIRVRIAIGNVYFDAGEIAKGGVVFAKAAEESVVLDNVHREGFLVAAAIGLLKCGEVEAADEVLDKVEDKTEIAGCLSGFSRFFQQNDEMEDAVEAIEEAFAMLKSQTEYEIRDTKARNLMLANVAIQFQRVGLNQRAVEIAHQNEDGRRRNEALTSIGQLLVMDGKADEADDVIKGVEPESERVAAFIGLSDAANTVDNTEEAVQYAVGALELLSEVEQHIVRADVSDEIAMRLNAYGRTSAAVDAARNNIDLVAAIRDEGGQAAALLRLARVYKTLEIEPGAAELETLDTIVKKINW